MTVSDEEYRRVKTLNEQYAEKILRLSAMIHEFREIVRLARRFVETPSPDESFLEDLRDALNEAKSKEDSAG